MAPGSAGRPPVVLVASCPLCPLTCCLSRGSAAAAPAAAVPGLRENVAAKCLKMVASHMFNGRYRALVAGGWRCVRV